MKNQPTKEFDFNKIFKRPNLLIRAFLYLNNLEGLKRDKLVKIPSTTFPLGIEFDGVTSWYKTIDFSKEPHLSFKTPEDLNWINKTLSFFPDFKPTLSSAETLIPNLKLFTEEMKSRQELFNRLQCVGITYLPEEYSVQIKPWVLIIPDADFLPQTDKNSESFKELITLLRIGRSYGLYIFLQNPTYRLDALLVSNLYNEVNKHYFQTRGDEENICILDENIGEKFKKLSTEVSQLKKISNHRIYPLRNQFGKMGKISTPDFAVYVHDEKYVFIDILGKNREGQLIVQNFYTQDFGLISEDKIQFLTKTRFHFGL